MIDVKNLLHNFKVKGFQNVCRDTTCNVQLEVTNLLLIYEAVIVSSFH